MGKQDSWGPIINSLRGALLQIDAEEAWNQAAECYSSLTRALARPLTVIHRDYSSER